MVLMTQSYNPSNAVTLLVWANPRSLATTSGIIIIFFSSGYLDVSVLRVCSIAGDISSIYRVAPFGNLRIKSYVQIPEAYRSLSRPSSPLRAQASAIRPYLAFCTFCSFILLILRSWPLALSYWLDTKCILCMLSICIIARY